MISRLVQMIRERGLRQTLAALVRRLRALAYGHERLIVLHKDLDSIKPLGRQGGLQLDDLGREHLDALAALNSERGTSDADARFASYLDQGFHGFVAFRDGELVGYYWWVDREGQGSFPDLRDLGLGIELGSGEVYGSDFYVRECHRGGGTAGEFLYLLETSLSERGYSRIWGYLLAENRAALWTYGVRGYERDWTVDSRRYFQLRRTRRVPAGAEGA